MDDYSILDAIGNTPLIKIEDGIYAKAEYMNPSGSVKDRIAKYIIERAEREGLLKPGDTIVESTSGNTGNAFSFVAAAKGYKMIVLIPDGYTTERTKISKAFGADVQHVGHFHVNHAREQAIRMGKQDGFFCPEQFDSEWNIDENREWLGEEILDQMPNNITFDAMVHGVGTGGTLIGVGQCLRKKHNPNMLLYATEPMSSRTLELGIVDEHKIEGIADGFVPTIFERNRDMINGFCPVDNDDAVQKAQDLTKRGLFVGASSGANLIAARQLRKEHPHLKNILTFLCDRGEKYLSSIYA
ncbi:MAG: PLP-dependent cysteine synthase family protein [Bdellovibrionales bacterium]